MKNISISILFFLSTTTAIRAQSVSFECEKQEIRRVLDKQIAGWNSGSIEQFMEGYAQTDSVRFASGGNITVGWNAMLARYKKGYPDKAVMGQLQFTDISISCLAPDAALVFGKWSLLRASDAPWGLFSLVFRKLPEGWRIIHDHTSSSK